MLEFNFIFLSPLHEEESKIQLELGILQIELIIPTWQNVLLVQFCGFEFYDKNLENELKD